ncbi:MAG TPA: carbamoyl phosphate synthase large subunit, partial [Thermoanaerobaculia bacterium]|nr:carbamoyl phosphate synthase large subunit [Thermoanaerobaculia bacterium]
WPEGGPLHVLEVNPRASRTVPFIAKAVGLPLVDFACQVMAGRTLAEIGFTAEPRVPARFVKAPVFPFRRFPGVDPILGPEMKSTGEVMGVAPDFGTAFAKAWLGAGNRLPLAGRVFVSVHDRDKPGLLPVARQFAGLGFTLAATGGTAEFLEEEGLPVERVRKLHEGRPHVIDELINGDLHLVINTASGSVAHADDVAIRQRALQHGVPCITTLSGAMAAAAAIAALGAAQLEAVPLQRLGAQG